MQVYLPTERHAKHRHLKGTRDAPAKSGTVLVETRRRRSLLAISSGTGTAPAQRQRQGQLQRQWQ